MILPTDEKKLATIRAVKQMKIAVLDFNTLIAQTDKEIENWKIKAQKQADTIALYGRKKKTVKALAYARTRLDLLNVYRERLLENRAEYKERMFRCLRMIAPRGYARAIVDYTFYPDPMEHPTRQKAMEKAMEWFSEV